ncbi:hypothetical protein STK_24440 [Sulfurisphaera tokodaii str. 7]|uniref:Uncharacterized protein n=2 Tax=Sulfurisphaera tokodaii TaxID=111955 RepID=Q96XS3_SULTO|nr:hypothetical protein STK_24440 [Sulfurisphaera tokodaii str. 7]
MKIMDYFEDYILPEIFKFCSQKSDPWECFISKVYLLPLSMENKKKILRNFIDKRVGRKVFIAGYLAKYLYNCDYFGECEPNISPIIPDDIVIQIFRIIRDIKKDDQAI